MDKSRYAPYVKPLILVLGVLLLCCCVGAVGAGIYLYQYQSPKQQSTQIDSAVNVYLSAPYAPLGWPSNSFIPIKYEVNATQNIDTIELYVNGQIYDSRHLLPDEKTTTFSAPWDWQPGAKGDYILVVQARDAEGMNGSSQPLYLHITEPVSMVSPQVATEGQTLQEIAEQQAKPVEQLVKVNPGVAADQPLSGSQIIYVPLEPADVVNPHVIESFEPAQPETPDPQHPGLFLPHPPIDIQTLIDSGAIPPQDEQGDKQEPAKMPDPGDKVEQGTNPDDDQKIRIDFGIPVLDKIMGNLGQLLEDKQKDSKPSDSSELYSKNAPVPTIEIEVKNLCDPNVKITNFLTYGTWMEYSGFKVYRSTNGGPLELFMTLPPIPVDYYAWPYKTGIEDKQQFGLVTYTVSVITPKGELVSAPASKSLPGCQDPNPDPLQPSIDADGNLKMPEGMDLAYFYIQMTDENGANSKGWRVPEGDRFFRPDTGEALNINYYLDSILSDVQLPEMTLQMEFWGWVGDKLVHAGNYTYSVFRNVLLVCSVPGPDGCVNGGPGSWVRDMRLTADQYILDQQINIKLITSKKSKLIAYTLRYQEKPSRDRDWNYTYAFRTDHHILDDDVNEHVFLVKMRDTIFPSYEVRAADKSIVQFSYPSARIDKGINFRLYIRALPRYEDFALPKVTTNDVAIFYDMFNEDDDRIPTLAATMPSIFSVEIMRDSYQPPNFEVPAMWGCVVVEKDPTGKYQVGSTICPPRVSTEPCGDFSSWSSVVCGTKEFVSLVAEGWDKLATWYEDAKNFIAEGLASIIPGCKSNDKCLRVFRYGVDVAVQYTTGLPPSLPKSREVFSTSVSEGIYQGAVYGVSYVSGLESDTIKGWCEEYLDCKERIKAAVEEFYDEQISRVNQPSCMDPAAAASHGIQNVCLDPSIIVHAAPGGMSSAGVVGVRVTRSNSLESLAVPDDQLSMYRVHLTSRVTNSVDGVDRNEPAFIMADIYKMNEIAPGESREFFLSLRPDYSGPGTYLKYYFGGLTQLKATEVCMTWQTHTWEWVPCNGTTEDIWEFTNPASALEGMP